MALSNLTGGGWIILFLALMVDLKLIFEFVAYVAALRSEKRVKAAELDLALPALFTTWLLYLLS